MYKKIQNYDFEISYTIFDKFKACISGNVYKGSVFSFFFHKMYSTRISNFFQFHIPKESKYKIFLKFILINPKIENIIRNFIDNKN